MVAESVTSLGCGHFIGGGDWIGSLFFQGKHQNSRKMCSRLKAMEGGSRAGKNQVRRGCPSKGKGPPTPNGGQRECGQTQEAGVRRHCELIAG